MTTSWRLQLTLIGPDGERYEVATPLDDDTAHTVHKIKPIGGYYGYFPGQISMEEAVDVLRTKEFRKGLFKRSAAQLAQLLAERMEDAEGWHDIERVEPAKAALGGKT